MWDCSVSFINLDFNCLKYSVIVRGCLKLNEVLLQSLNLYCVTDNWYYRGAEICYLYLFFGFVCSEYNVWQAPIRTFTSLIKQWIFCCLLGGNLLSYLTILSVCFFETYGYRIVLFDMYMHKAQVDIFW